MKSYLYNKVEKALRGLIPLMLLTIVPSFTACSDDDDNNQSATMTINKIYLETTDAEDENYDREVDFARLGQTLRIEGSGFTGLKKIYVNSYETYFNNALMTDNNVWVTLNSKTPVAKADESVRNTITFIKDNTQTVHQFTIRAAAPNISGIDNTLPMTGETVKITGTNLDGTTKITLPDGTEITDGIVNDEEEGEWVSFTMPSGVAAVSGSITTEGANGTAISPAYFNNNDCYVINFDGKGVQGGWSATFSADDLVDDPLNSGRGKVVQIIPESYLAENPDGVKAGVASIKGFWTAGNDNADDDWNRMTQFIPGTTPADSVALQFDVYCPEPWESTGQIEITLQNNLSNYGYGSGCTQYNKDYLTQGYAWVPWLNRETGKAEAFTTGERWQTITIPLSEFGRYTNNETAWTFQNVIDDKNGGSYKNFGILFCNPDLKWNTDLEDADFPARNFNQKIYLDNFRIVPITAVSVSDF